MIEVFVSVLLVGILAGAVYGLFSVGLSLGFGVMRLVNFAHGEFVMLGMYAAFVLVEVTHASLYAMVPIVILAAVPVGYLVYVLFFRGTGLNAASHDQLIISLGLSIVLQNVALNIFGTTAKALNPTSIPTLKLGWLYVPEPQLIAFGVSVALTLLLDQTLQRTQVGRAVRAIVADREVASMLGINVQRIYTLAFVVSIVLAAIAGAILYGYFPVSPDVGANFILLGFIAVVIGGIGDFRGAFVAGVLIGVTESLVTTYWAASVQDVVAFAAFILVVVLRPQGLFGRAVA